MSRFTKRLSGFSNRRGSGKTGNEVGVPENLPSHPGAAIESMPTYHEENLSVQQEEVQQIEYKGIARSSVQDMLSRQEVDLRLRPEWYESDDVSMDLVFEQLLVEVLWRAMNTTTKEDMIRQCADVAPKYILAVEHMAASGGEESAKLATARALAWSPAPSSKDAVWSKLCYGAFSAVGANINEEIIECLAAELVALCTSYSVLGQAAEALSRAIVAYALANALFVDELGISIKKHHKAKIYATEQWAAALGNLTPERGAMVLELIVIEPCTGKHALGSAVLGLTRFIRLNLHHAPSREAFVRAVQALIGTLDNYLFQGVKDVPKNVVLSKNAPLRDEISAQACVTALEVLVSAIDIEDVRLEGSIDLDQVDNELHSLFKRIDEVWAPRKMTPLPRLSKSINNALSTLAVACMVRLPRDIYGANLELFVNKRLQKPAMDKKEAPRALVNMATFLRGPRWTNAEKTPAATRWPRAPCTPIDENDDSEDGGAYLLKKRWSQTTKNLLPRDRPRTLGGYRPRPHAFECCMPVFEHGTGLFRPEVLVWIREKSFLGAHYRVADLAANARLAADVVLGMLTNSLSTSFVRSLVVQEDASILSATKSSTERLERYLVGIRVMTAVLDTNSGFARYAPHTPFNALTPGASSQVQTDLIALFVKSAPEQLVRSLDALTNEQFSASNCTGEAAMSKPIVECVLNLFAAADAEQESEVVAMNTWSTAWDAVDGPKYDARIQLVPDALPPLKLVHACILQETARSVPLAPWRSLGKAVLDAGVLNHPAYCVRRSFALALQRTLLERPKERVILVSDVLAHAATCLTDGAFPSRLRVLGAANTLLELWTRVLRDGADGRDRASAAADADAVLELSQQSSDLGWTARAEATALAFLADDNRDTRDIALQLLDHVLAIRNAMLRLVDTVGTTAELEKLIIGTSNQGEQGDDVRRRASAMMSSQNSTIRQVLSSQGVEEDIANRAVRSFVDKSSPSQTNNKQPLAHTSAPTLRKVSRMANELWYGALPLLAAAVGQNLDSARAATIAAWAQRLLYASLKKRGAYRSAPDRFQAQLGLLLALHFFKSSSELEQFLTQAAWPLLIDEGLETEKITLQRLCACCRAASAPAARSIVSSLLDWLNKVVESSSPERRTLRRAYIWALLRATVESPVFRSGDAAVDTQLISMLAAACVSNSFLDAHKTTSQSVVDRALLLDAVAAAIVNIYHNIDIASVVEDGKKKVSLPCWAAPELLRLYEWLRQTHIWPRPGGALHNKWHVPPAKPELAASHDDEPCTTGKGVPDPDGLCLSVAGRAAAKLLCMGAFLPKEKVEALLDEKSPPIDLSWFLTAEKLGPAARCLPWLLSYNAQTLAEAFVRRAVSAPRESALPFFHAIADQLLPAASLPLPPEKRSAPNVEDSSRYFAQVKRFGLEADLAQLGLAHIGDSTRGGNLMNQQRPPAVASGAVFGDDRFVAGRPERLGACAVLLLGLRAMRDGDVNIRVRAFLLVRTVTLYLLGDRAQSQSRDFEELMASYWVQFSSENASRRDVECDEILHCVCSCLGAAGDSCLRELLACLVGAHARNRDEWGSSGATACILGALCKHLDLAAEAAYSAQNQVEDPPPRLSSPRGSRNLHSSNTEARTISGDQVLSQLLHFCAAHPEQSSALFTALCARGGGSRQATQRNAAAIVNHVIRAAALAARENKPLTLAACQSATLAAYAAAPDLVATLLSAPLDFAAHERAVDAARGAVGNEDDDAMLEANGAVALLSSLGGAAPDAIGEVARLATIFNFAVLHFASPTRFGGGAHSLSSEFRERHRIPRLLHTLLLNLQPRFLSFETNFTANESSEIPHRVNALLALLRCGVEAEFLELDWSRPVAALADPTLLCRRDGADTNVDQALSTTAWLAAVPPLEIAAGGGGLAHPVALVRALAQVLEVACPGVTRRWGEEALRFGLASRDFPTRLKAVVIYLTLGAPGVVTALPTLLSALATLHARLSSEAADSTKSSTGVASTAHYQAASSCCALLRIAGAALFESQAPASTLFWIADAALRTRCQDDTRCRIYRYGIAILRAFCATNLIDTDIGSVIERLQSSDMAVSANRCQALTSSPLLDAAARLASGLLSDDDLTFSDARLAVTAVLARVVTAAAPKKKEARAALACILSALGPWLMARAGSLDVVDTATQLSTVVEAGAGDGGYLASTLRDQLVLATPPDPTVFAQRAAAWLCSAATSASDPQRLLARFDTALASASSVSSHRDSARVAAALAIAAELLLRDDGGPEAAAVRAQSLTRVSAVALNLFSKTAVRTDSMQQHLKTSMTTTSSPGVMSRASTRLRGLARSSFASLRVPSASIGTNAIGPNVDWSSDGVDDDERLAASAVVALVVQRRGLAAALLDSTTNFIDGDDFLGDDDNVVSERLLLLAQRCHMTPAPIAPSPPPSDILVQKKEQQLSRLRDHPSWEPYAQYAALIRRGVPLGAVRLRMTTEGLDPAILDLDPDKPAPPDIFASSTEQQTKINSAADDIKVKPPLTKKKPPPPPRRLVS